MKRDRNKRKSNTRISFTNFVYQKVRAKLGDFHAVIDQAIASLEISRNRQCYCSSTNGGVSNICDPSFVNHELAEQNVPSEAVSAEFSQTRSASSFREHKASGTLFFIGNAWTFSLVASLATWIPGPAIQETVWHQGGLLWFLHMQRPCAEAADSELNCWLHWKNSVYVKCSL